ncbi:MAG: sigma 54-interacting transcriptional regulator [Gammaproteobacteria bacterium]|nr:sigma 54-interacting transcriptional regulator [Gammaproteobacteria bacterium]
MLKEKQMIDLLVPLLDPIQDGVIICTSAGNILFVNPATRELLQLDAADHALSLANLGGHNLRASLIRAGLNSDAGDRHHCELVMKFDEEIRVNGESRWFRIHSALLDLPDRAQALRMIVLRDITPEKRLLAVISSKEACGVATEDPDMLRLIERLSTVAGSDASVLLQGESGTGKTELARLVHRRSKRADRPFVEINCGAIPATLIESELFGHVKGAFTGAVKQREGRFKSADGGTLFLDEIGELPRELQPKLLRVLQDGEYEPVGSDTTVKADVRLICASNIDLREQVDDGLFRADLYYRIAVVPLRVPPLRDRPGDIPLLIDVIRKRLVLRGYPVDIEFGSDARNAMMNYPWPGNVRELANAVEHCIICAEDGTVVRDSLPDTIRMFCEARNRTSQQNGVTADADDDSRQQITHALRKANGNKTLAAQLLGIDRTTLWRRMQRLGLT